MEKLYWLTSMVNQMVKFKDWEEMWWFLKTYCNFSCVNCTYGGGKPSQFIFCLESISMVDLNLMTVCTKWTSDDGKELKDFEGSFNWNLPDEIIDKLESGALTVGDLRENPNIVEVSRLKENLEVCNE